MTNYERVMGLQEQIKIKREDLRLIAKIEDTQEMAFRMQEQLNNISKLVKEEKELILSSKLDEEYVDFAKDLFGV